MQQARTEFAQALRAVATERKLDVEVILSSIEEAIVAAYKRDAREQGRDMEELDALTYEVQLDPGNGETHIYTLNPDNPEEKTDVTPPGFGRIAAQTAKQVIHQKIREAEKGAIMDEFSGRVGSLISGIVLRFDGSDVRVDLGRTEGLMLAEERIPNERLNLSQRITFLIKSIKETPKGKQILLSRADPMFVQKLFEREVPEMSAGSVIVKAIAREAGTRTKMAVFSEQSGVDPVGSCVGQKGVRVQAVTNELGGERVDIIQYTEDASELVKASLSPADGVSISLDKDEKVANVVVPEEQLSLAIGKDGQNARLAAKLTGWKIKITGDGVTAEKKDVVEEKDEVKETENEVVDNNEQIADAEKREEPKSSEEQTEQKDGETPETVEETPQASEEPKAEEVAVEEKTA